MNPMDRRKRERAREKKEKERKKKKAKRQGKQREKGVKQERIEDIFELREEDRGEMDIFQPHPSSTSHPAVRTQMGSITPTHQYRPPGREKKRRYVRREKGKKHFRRRKAQTRRRHPL